MEEEKITVTKAQIEKAWDDNIGGILFSGNDYSQTKLVGLGYVLKALGFKENEK